MTWDDDGGAPEALYAWRTPRAGIEPLREDRWEDDGGPCIGAYSFIEVEIEWAEVQQQGADDTRYGSVSEFLAAIRGPCAHPANTEIRDKRTKHGRPDPLDEDWLGAGCKSGMDVQRMITEGWPEGIAIARKLLEDIDLDDLIPFDRRRRQQHGDFGDNIDISAVYRGHHATAWTRARRRHSIAPQHITVVANCVIPRIENSRALFWRGAAAMCLSDLLETAGYSVRLVIGFGGMAYDYVAAREDQQSLRITVKDHGMPLDISTATATLLPGFSRALCIGWSVTARDYALTPSKWNLWVGSPVKEDGELVASHDITDMPSARAWLINALTSINVEDE